MEDFNIFLFLYDFFFTLKDFANFLYGFIFMEVTIGTYTFQPVVVLGGGIIVTFIILKLVKDFIPLV